MQTYKPGSVPTSVRKRYFWASIICLALPLLARSNNLPWDFTCRKAGSEAGRFSPFIWSCSTQSLPDFTTAHES